MHFRADQSSLQKCSSSRHCGARASTEVAGGWHRPCRFEPPAGFVAGRLCRPFFVDPPLFNRLVPFIATNIARPRTSFDQEHARIRATSITYDLWYFGLLFPFDEVVRSRTVTVTAVPRVRRERISKMPPIMLDRYRIVASPIPTTG